jgi:predicted phage terminase large subunit-like protein
MYLPSLEEIQIEKKKRLFKKSYYEFVKEAVQVLEPETDWFFNWHIEFLCNEFQEIIERVGQKKPKKYDLNINVSPGSSKSYIVSRLLAPWSWLKYPHLRFLISTHTYNLSTSLVSDTNRKSNCMRSLIQSDWYKQFCDLEFNDSMTSVANNKGGEAVPSSSTSTITGSHFDILISDDQLDNSQARSKTYIDKIANYYFNTLSSRKRNPETAVQINVQQRLTEEDISGQIIGKRLKYKHIVIPALDSDSVQPKGLKKFYKNGLFFPKRFSQARLEDERKKIGSLQFEGQYQQKPAPLGGTIFKREWFSQRFDPLQIKATRHFVSDTAYGKEGSDNSVTLCFAIENDNLYLFNIWKVNLEFPQFVNQYPQFVKSNGYNYQSKCYFEPKATGSSTVQQLKQQTDLNVLEDVNPKDSKETRAYAVSAVLESGRVYLANGVNWEDFIEECILFPNGKHDDQVDTLIMAINKLISSKVGIKKQDLMLPAV